MPTSAWRCCGRPRSGRLGVDLGGRVEVLPVNITVDDGPSVLVAVASGTRLQEAINHPVVIEADGWDVSRGVGWSVVVRGRASHARRSMYSAHQPQPWPRGRDHLIRIRVEEITGRRVARSR